MSERIRMVLNQGSHFSHAYLAWFEIMEEADDDNTLKDACETYREYQTAELLDLIHNARHTTDKLMRLREDVRERYVNTMAFLESRFEILAERKMLESLNQSDTEQRIEEIMERFKNIIRDNQPYRHKMPFAMAKRVAVELALEALQDL